MKIIAVSCLPIDTALALPLIFLYGAFSKLRRAAVNFVISARLSAPQSICPRGTTRLALDRFSYNFIFHYSFENLSRKFNIYENWTTITGTLKFKIREKWTATTGTLKFKIRENWTTVTGTLKFKIREKWTTITGTLKFKIRENWSTITGKIREKWKTITGTLHEDQCTFFYHISLNSS